MNGRKKKHNRAESRRHDRSSSKVALLSPERRNGISFTGCWNETRERGGGGDAAGAARTAGRRPDRCSRRHSRPRDRPETESEDEKSNGRAE